MHLSKRIHRLASAVGDVAAETWGVASAHMVSSCGSALDLLGLAGDDFSV